jgi:hypothetical protein
MAIDEKRQESRHAGISCEPGAHKNVRELGADVSGGRLVGAHEDSRIGRFCRGRQCMKPRFYPQVVEPSRRVR